MCRKDLAMCKSLHYLLLIPIENKQDMSIDTAPGIIRFKPRSHALIYTRYVNYTCMYNLHPGVKIYLLRVHMFLRSFGLNCA